MEVILYYVYKKASSVHRLFLTYIMIYIYVVNSLGSEDDKTKKKIHDYLYS